MKKLWIKISLLVMLIFAIYPYGKFNVYALDGTCFPTWDGDWILNTYLDWLNCTFPSWWYKIYGNVYVGRNWDFTINISDWVTMGVDLSSNFIDFTDSNWNIRGKIQLQWTAKIENSVSNRYYVEVSYDIDGDGITKCPKWTVALNLTWTQDLPQSDINNASPLLQWQIKSVALNGSLYCVKIWSNARYTCEWKQWDDNTNQYVDCDPDDSVNGRNNNECAKVCLEN